MSQAIEFALLLRSHFQNGDVAIHPDLGWHPALSPYMSSGVVTTHGALNLSYEGISTKVHAECSMTIPAHWKTRSPHLRCSNRWIRHQPEVEWNTDWHVNSDYSLCYMLDDQWADSIAFETGRHGHEAAMEYAAFYAVNNAKWLLYHHLEGYRRKLSKWPLEWPQWPHFNEGKIAYYQWKKIHHKNS